MNRWQHPPIPDGLVLRAATPADRSQVEELLLARGEPGDDVDHRLVMDDPDAGWASCAVVVDGDRVASTTTLLDETVVLEDVALPAGQVELVATDPAYEGRGLVRALMGWAHERSAARGHLLQVMIGIPYFYRLFGYEYAVDIPPARPLQVVPPGRAALRPASPDDIPALAGLQESTQTGFQVRVPHPKSRWHWLLQQTTSGVHLLERHGEVVASARVRTAADAGDGVLLAEAAAVDIDAAHALLGGVVQLAGEEEVEVVDRVGTVPSRAWEQLLGSHESGPEQYYLRLADVPGVLRAVQPVLERRLAASSFEPSAVVISTFGRHYRWSVDGEGWWSELEVGGPLQSPGVVGGAGVAPDALPALLFGQRGMAGLATLRPDVYAGAAAELFEVLFPPLTADLLTYYLPW